jgi:hypothetical protein
MASVEVEIFCAVGSVHIVAATAHGLYVI